MIFLDYQLDPSHVKRLTDNQILSADDTSLDYYLFYGDVYFRVNEVSFDPFWGLIPVIFFSMQLCEISCGMADGEMSSLEFTEVEEQIHFLRAKDIIQITCDYSDARAQTSLPELRDASIDFANRVFDDLSNRWPLLKSTKAFQEKLDIFRSYTEHCR